MKKCIILFIILSCTLVYSFNFIGTGINYSYTTSSEIQKFNPFKETYDFSNGIINFGGEIFSRISSYPIFIGAEGYSGTTNSSLLNYYNKFYSVNFKANIINYKFINFDIGTSIGNMYILYTLKYPGSNNSIDTPLSCDKKVEIHSNFMILTGFFNFNILALDYTEIFFKLKYNYVYPYSNAWFTSNNNPVDGAIQKPFTYYNFFIGINFGF